MNAGILISKILKRSHYFSSVAINKDDYQSKDLPEIFEKWARDWNKAEKALSIQVAINKQSRKKKINFRTEGTLH